MENRHRSMAITMLFALALLVSIGFSGSVSASPYNISIDTTHIYSTQWCVYGVSLTTPIDPKIACDTDGSNCIALVYDTCFGNGVRIIWSVDKFATHEQVIGTIPISIGSSFLDYYELYGNELPYDVEYYDPQKVFYIVANNQVYAAFTQDLDGAGPQAALPTYYTPSSPLVTPTQTYGSTISINCAAILTSPKNWAGLGYSCSYQSDYAYKFEDGNATNLWGIELCQPYDSSPIDWDGVLCEWNYDVTNSTYPNLKTNVAELDYTQSCSAGGNFGIDNISATAFYTGSDWKYRVFGQVDYCTGTVDHAVSVDTLASPQNDFLHTYFGGSLYWRNVTNVTENISGYIYKATTSDFVSYGPTDLVYTEDYTKNETINQSDIATGGSTNLYVWERKTQGGSDESNNGIWLYRESNYQVYVETDAETPVSVNLYCNETGSDYYDSGSGDQFTLNTPCQDNNRLIITSTYSPSTYIDYVDIPSSCLSSGMYIRLKYAQSPYNHTFTVRTDSNLPVPGATVTVAGSGSNTTNSNGQAIISLQTISGPTLDRNNYSTCEIRYSTGGSGLSKTYIIEKSGFIDVSGSLSAPSKTTLGGYNVWSFDTTTEETLYESGMFLNISLKAGADVDVSPCNYEVNVSGPGYIAVMLNGVPNLGSTWDSFPVEFKLNDSSSPVNVTIDLTLPNGTHIIEYEDIAYDERVDHIFYLPFSVDNLVCESNCDCPESTCVGKYFYQGQTNLCGSDNTCDYNISNCQLPEFCDDNVGCFNADTTVSCTRDSDCADSCVDSDTMIWGRCGADGLCKNITYECAVECNQTANICEELRSCELGESLDVKAFIYKPGGEQLNLLSGSFTCDATNIGKRACIGGGTEDNAIPKSQLTYYGKTINDVYITPEGWSYTTSADGLYYNFSDISVYCNSTCSISYDICDGNCDQDTGECVTGVGSISNTIRALLPSWLQFMLDSLFLWTFLSLIIGAILTYIPSKISPNAQPTPQFGLAGMFVMFMIGIPLGFVNPIIGLFIVLGIGMYLAKMISSQMAGG